MKRYLAVLMALMAMLALCACGSKTPAQAPAQSAGVSETETAPKPTPVPEPEPVLDPDEIEWGYQSPDIMDAQYWYVDGDKSATSFIFFEDDCLTTVDGETRNTVDTKTVDKHIVDAKSDGAAFDFVFTDALTCYDIVSKQWYMRSDYQSVVNSLTTATFVCELGSQWKYTFNTDGTMIYDNDGTQKTGKWWIGDARTIKNRFDYEQNSGGWFTINYEEGSWNILSIEAMDVYYPEKQN